MDTYLIKEIVGSVIGIYIFIGICHLIEWGQRNEN